MLINKRNDILNLDSVTKHCADCSSFGCRLQQLWMEPRKHGHASVTKHLFLDLMAKKAYSGAGYTFWGEINHRQCVMCYGRAWLCFSMHCWKVYHAVLSVAELASA